MKCSRTSTCTTTTISSAERRTQDEEDDGRVSRVKAPTRSTTTPATTSRRPMATSTRSVRIEEYGAQFELARGVHQRARRHGGVVVHPRAVHARGPESRAPDRREQLRPGVQRLRGLARRAPIGSPMQLLGDALVAAVPAAPADAEAVRAGAADGGGRRPGGEEIFTDKYGRVKVQFHWDRRGKKDENSSCWIRVAHPWAGKNWGIDRHAADRAGGHRRLPGGRSRPADHHRPRLQRRADAALRSAGQQDADRA